MGAYVKTEQMQNGRAVYEQVVLSILSTLCILWHAEHAESQGGASDFANTNVCMCTWRLHGVHLRLPRKVYRC